MSGIYSVEDLLKLRASPLIVKPASLPPIEEWLGTQDANPKRPTTRGKGEESISQTESFQKRPALADAQQRRSTTDPDRIVLGPPRRSFASSNTRGLGRISTQDGNEDLPTSKEFMHDRRKTGEFDLKDDGTQYEKSRRRQDNDETELRVRREHDHNRPRWGPRERESQQEVDDETGEVINGRSKRDSQGRSRFEQPWFRNERGGEDGKREQEKPEWRGGGRERQWGRNERVEEEPEWMDAPAPVDEPQARTVEDFQRWKEKMKAGATGGVTERVEPAIQTPIEEKLNTRSPLPPLVPSAEMGDTIAMDKFFARFTEQKSPAEEKPATKPSVKTRFASFFSPVGEPSLKQDIITPSPAPESSNGATKAPMPTTEAPSSAEADQAGFARILEMLQSRSNNPTPQTSEAKPRVPLYARDGHSKPREELRSPVAPPASAFEYNEPPVSTSNDGRWPMDTPHTRQQSSLSKDEILLNLLKQSNISGPQRQAPAPQQPEQRYLPEFFGINSGQNGGEPVRHMPAHRDPPQRERPREMGRIPLHAPITNTQYHENPVQQEMAQQRPANGSYTFLDLLRDEHPAQMRGPPQQRDAGLPRGLQRPPGFEQSPIGGAPPGWPPAQHQQPLNPGRQAPPPGFPNLPPGIRPSNGFANPPQQPQPQARPQRKYTGEGPLPEFPPGMAPPPGYANVGLPPPPGLYGRYAEQSQSAQSGFMDMLRGNGTGSGMPGYR